MRIGEGDAMPFHAAIEMSLVPIVLADPHRDDCPVVYANAAFCEMTGYPVEEVVGRNCRFLQGPDTDKDTVKRLSAAIAARWNVHEELLNYRKDGSAFWNALFVNPVFDQGGRLVYLFGTQLDVTRRRLLESALTDSRDLLAVVESSLAAALSLPLADAQRAHLDRAQRAMHEIRRQQAHLLGQPIDPLVSRI